MVGIRVTHELPDVKILMVNYPIFLSSLRLSFPTFYNLINTVVLSSVFSEEDMKRYFFCLFFETLWPQSFPAFFFPFLSDAFPKAMKREITNNHSFHVPFQSTPKKRRSRHFGSEKKEKKFPRFTVKITHSWDSQLTARTAKD